MAIVTYKVFVFGTLKKGYPNHGYNRGMHIPGLFRTVESYPLYLVGERFSPWLVDLPGDGMRVQGEVFEVNKMALGELDILERIDKADGYRRQTIMVENMQTGKTLEVQVYIKPGVQLDRSAIRIGPLPNYEMSHARRYRSRQSMRS